MIYFRQKTYGRVGDWITRNNQKHSGEILVHKGQQQLLRNTLNAGGLDTDEIDKKYNNKVEELRNRGGLLSKLARGNGIFSGWARKRLGKKAMKSTIKETELGPELDKDTIKNYLGAKINAERCTDKINRNLRLAGKFDKDYRKTFSATP